MILRTWQVEAKKAWKDAKFRGTVEAATGVGKTFFGIDSIKDIKGRVLIVVHTEVLLKQWETDLKLAFPNEEIGVYYGKKKTVGRIMVAIINSLAGKQIRDCELIIADECHHYQSKKNHKFFLHNTFEKILCLSATAKVTEPYNDYLIKIAPIIYKYSQKRAIIEKVLCDYDVENIPVAMDFDERQAYHTTEEYINTMLPLYNYDFTRVMREIGNDLTAMRLARAVNRRKTIIYGVKSKTTKAVEVIKANITSKFIIFDERIINLERLHAELIKDGINAGIYHSELKHKEREQVLFDFKNNVTSILLSAKCLDEGLNVPNANVAMILNGSSQARQFIQRLGRVLRKAKGKEKAMLYQIYVPNTVDEKWLAKRSL